MAGTGVLPFLRGVDFSGNDFKVFYYFDDTYIMIYYAVKNIIVDICLTKFLILSEVY